MTDVATGFLQSVTAFGATRLGRASSTTFKDTGSLMSSLSDGVSASNKTKFDQLKADIEADVALVKPIVTAIEKQTALIAKMASESITDANTASFTAAEAGRVAVRIGTALLAIDAAVSIVATELAKDVNGVVNTTTRDALMAMWNPWVQPFKDLDDGAGKLVDSVGKQVLGIDNTAHGLADVLSFDRDNFRLAARPLGTGDATSGCCGSTRPRSRPSSASPAASSWARRRPRSSTWSSATGSGGGRTRRSSGCGSSRRSARACRTTRCSRRSCPARPTRRPSSRPQSPSTRSTASTSGTGRVRATRSSSYRSSSTSPVSRSARSPWASSATRPGRSPASR